jgi:hypothetical protein
VVDSFLGAGVLCGFATGSFAAGVSAPISGQSEDSEANGSSLCAVVDETSKGTIKLVKMVHIRTILIKRIIKRSFEKLTVSI